MTDIRSIVSPHDPLDANVGAVERGASVTLGAALLAFAFSGRRPRDVLLLAAAGAYFGYRGLTGRCALYEALDLTTAGEEDDGAFEISDDAPSATITIGRPVDEVYAFWRDFANMPRFMPHVRRVEVADAARTHWVAEGPEGIPVEWDAMILDDRPGELIAWRSVPGSEVHHAGRVRFRPAPADRGTEIHVAMDDDRPAGRVGRVVARLFGLASQQELDEDLRRLKQILESGEIATTEGQPSGPTTPAGELAFQATRAALEARS